MESDTPNNIFLTCPIAIGPQKNGTLPQNLIWNTVPAFDSDSDVRPDAFGVYWFFRFGIAFIV